MKTQSPSKTQTRSIFGYGVYPAPYASASAAQRKRLGSTPGERVRAILRRLARCASTTATDAIRASHPIEAASATRGAIHPLHAGFTRESIPHNHGPPRPTDSSAKTAPSLPLPKTKNRLTHHFNIFTIPSISFR